MASVAAPAGAAVDSTTAPPQADITLNKVPDAKEKRRRDVVQTTRWLMGKVSGLVVDVGGVQAVELETGAEVDSKPTPETEQLASDVLHQLFALCEFDQCTGCGRGSQAVVCFRQERR